MNNKPVFDYPLFAMGFRAFFALAGLSALAFIALWNTIANAALPMHNYYSPTLWHAHEMLFGYSVAVIAGFLLTAVKNWTGLQPVTHDQLASLSLLWLYGRIVPFYAELLPDDLIAGIDLSFLPALAYFVCKPMLKTANYKNLIFVGLLLVLAVANGMIHAQILGIWETSAMTSLNLVVAAIVAMILVIAGRIFPYFTERGLSGLKCIRNPVLDIAAIICSLAALMLNLFAVSGLLLALAAFAAVLTNALRLAGWYDRRIWFVPLLWILFAGYGWIVLGFGLLGLSAYALIMPSLALHAFTLGGIGVLTIGMMARVALGHTGRVLKTSNLMAIAFWCINLAVLCRVLLPWMLPAWYSGLVWLSAYCWLAAYSLFVFYYAPILASPRTDGQSG